MNTQKTQLFPKLEFDLQKLKIGVASPKQIRQWSERYLPNGTQIGEVKSWETVNYKTLKPEPDGLFCQKTFGPVVDFTCACGKKAPKKKQVFCPKCGVERTSSRVRRYRLGYIKLKQPVVHPLYAAHRPSPLNFCLMWPTKRVQAVMRTAEFCSLSHIFTRFASKIESRTLFREQKSKFRISHLTKSNFEFQQNSQGIASFFLTNSDLSKKRTKRIKAPRLFSSKNQSSFRKFIFNSGAPEPRLYAISYDATWRQVETFQEFLFYLWEQSFSYESSVPYYIFTRTIENKKQEIPRHEQPYPLQTGGYAFQQILSYLDSRQLQEELSFFEFQLYRWVCLIKDEITVLDFNLFEHRKRAKRLRLKIRKLEQFKLTCRRQRETFRDFEQSKQQPAWMILSYLPVLPPGLRPITSIRGELVVSDINSLYRKVLIRNNRISRGINFGVFDTALSGSWLSWCYNLGLLQEAVDDLLKKGSVEPSGKTLKSLLDVLKGKQGRFRQHLLGKRVDYSGRSVIVVGPELQIHECGLPKQMAVELFQPFLIQKLRQTKIVYTTTAAKALIAERKPIVWSILGEIVKTHPILLNRAPTLHRLGIQAFLPKLVEGKAILLHPLVCPAFNADFDGDQMAVHVPLSAATRAEALDLLWSRNHLLAPSSGQPLLLPTQDMVLGFYYLTCSTEKLNKTTDTLISSWKALMENQPFYEIEQNLYFSNFSQVKKAYDRGFLNLHTAVWVKWSGFVQTFVTEQQSRTKDTIIETRIDPFGRAETLFLESCHLWNHTSSKDTFEPPHLVSSFSSSTPSQFVRTTPGRVLMHSWIFQEQKTEFFGNPSKKEIV